MSQVLNECFPEGMTKLWFGKVLLVFDLGVRIIFNNQKIFDFNLLIKDIFFLPEMLIWSLSQLL